MDIKIRFSSGDLRASDEEELGEIIARALDRFGRRVRHVQLFIEDVNGPRGGVDKQCRCVLHLNRMSPIIIQDEDANLGGLIHRIGERAAYAVSQKLARHRTEARAPRRLDNYGLGDFSAGST